MKVDSEKALFVEGTQAGLEDYIGEDGLLYCGKCRTRKQSRFCIPYLNREDVISVACECVTSARLKREEEERQLARRAYIASLRHKCIADESYRSMTFEADDGKGDRKAADVARKYVQYWHELSKQNSGLVFSGTPGTGKTFLACCIANALIDMQVEAMVTTIPALISEMSRDFEANKPDILQQIQSVDLIVLDDLGVERRTGFVSERLFEIVDARYRSGKPLIVTTNLSTEEICNPESLEYKRIFDRIIELCQPVQVQCESRRVDKAREKAQFVWRLFETDAT